MDYLSCFSGIGGLEAKGLTPTLCELDPYCRQVLQHSFPNSKIFNDLFEVSQIKIDLICGGWPCQDLSVAGKQRGLKGSNSGLFYKFAELAMDSGASTLVAENVSNLIKMENGDVFREVIRHLFGCGFKHISWRMLNARNFGLPHHRNRVFLVASKDQDICLSLFNNLPKTVQKKSDIKTAGFYWTAGTHAINYSKGYIPTLKVGSSIGIPSPPAIHYGDVVRQISWSEAVKLQGFNPSYFENIPKSQVLKMAGNAVAKPVGEFVLDCIIRKSTPNNLKFKAVQTDWLSDGLDNKLPKAGYFDGSIHEPYIEKSAPKCENLDEFIDFEVTERLSSRAAAGLIYRLEKSGAHCPSKLKNDLKALIDINEKL